MDVNINEAKAKLSQPVEGTMGGEEVLSAEAGKPMVNLLRSDGPRQRVLGSAAGTITYANAWAAAMDEQELAEFLGG